MVSLQRDSHFCLLSTVDTEWFTRLVVTLSLSVYPFVIHALDPSVFM